MQTKEIFDKTIQVLGKVLELRSQKIQTISSNIANAETPGYARHKMEFEEQLRETVIGTSQTVTHPRHMPNSPIQEIGSFQANFYRETDQSGIGDGNSVNLGQEMVDLSVNQIRFEAAILSLNKKFSMLKHVIQEKI
jgi:flagellar basal-body rod protein FlgB